MFPSAHKSMFSSAHLIFRVQFASVQPYHRKKFSTCKKNNLLLYELVNSNLIILTFLFTSSSAFVEDSSQKSFTVTHSGSSTGTVSLSNCINEN